MQPLLRWVLSLFVREELLPKGFEPDPDLTYIYVLESDALSNVLILQKAARAHNLPMPLSDIPVEGVEDNRLMSLQRLRGVWVRRPDMRDHLKSLNHMLSLAAAHPDKNVVLLPVLIMVGRAPEKDAGFFKILLSENWPIAGRIRRAFAVLVHGRRTLVQVGQPLHLNKAIEEKLGRSRTVRKVSRVLRVHFRQARTAAIGPDLSHRRTLVDEVLRSRPVREAIKARATKRNQSVAKSRRQARKYAEEIAADSSYTVIRIFSQALNWFWNKIYQGINVSHMRKFTDASAGAEIIYVPCHRSHIDYLLVSHLVHQNGYAVPHIAAGVNLNLPVVGPILRRGGAFFLRRSFKSNALYSAVFNEYVDTIFARGVSMEYFIEGGRSRTGRLLQPRTGMLAMTVRSFLKHPQRPVMFVPIYVGYERLVEGGAYLGELSGGQKKKESVGGLLRSFKILKERYGQVYVSFGEPIDLAGHLEQVAPDWKEAAAEAESKPQWLGTAVDSLANRIMTHINNCADVNPINLLATALLASPKNTMDCEDLKAHIEVLRKLLVAVPYTSEISVTSMPAEEIINRGAEMDFVRQVQHPLGDLITSGQRESWLLSYFRNNIVHLLVVPAWCACVFLNNMVFSREDLRRIGHAILPFVRSELFLHWTEEAFDASTERCLQEMQRIGLLLPTADPEYLQRAPGGSTEALQLKNLAQSLFPSLERYYITVALLVKFGSGALSSGELEQLCHLTAQRLSMIYTLDTPEFFDKSLFKQFIRNLKDAQIVTTDDAGKLEFSDQLEGVLADAKAILSKEVRHSIWQISPAPEALEHQPAD